MALNAAPRLIWAGAEVTLLGAPSPDGHWLSYVAAGDLAIRGIKTGEIRKLTRLPPGSKEFAYFSVFSPGSESAAYAWFNSQGFYDLRVVPLDGGEPRILFSNEESGFVQPCAWSPDGKQILTLLFRRDNVSQIAWIPVDGSAPRVLKTLNWSYPKRIDLSPDGRTIAYDSFIREGSYERGLFLLAADGGGERLFDSGQGSRIFPVWTADGRGIVYCDEATSDIREQPIAGGNPRTLAPASGRSLLMGVTRAGTLVYGVRKGSSDIYIADPGASPRRIPTRFPGMNSAPSWSPDGARLAYLSRRGSENYGVESRSVVINSLDGEGEQELALPLALIEKAGWGDDRTLLVKGSDSKGRAGVFCADLVSAEVKLCDLTMPPNAHHHPGGKRMAIVQAKNLNEVWALDLEARPAVPLGLDAYLPVPESNPMTRAKVELGKRLFHDKRLSRDGAVSCATCHDPARTFTDDKALAIGIGGMKGDRRTPRITNRAWGNSFFWDGRAKTLEDQVLQPIANLKEMALDPPEAARRAGLTVEELRDALASYVRTIVAGSSPYDRYVAGDREALTAQQREGLKLFRGKGGCVACHVGPNLTDEKLHETRLAAGARIKTPSLRDAARTPPYGHDGSLTAMSHVIDFYDAGGHSGGSSLQLTAPEKLALMEFIGALNGVIRDGVD